MLTHEELVPINPVGIRLSINEGPLCPLIGTEFVTICVLGARNGSNASLLLSGIENIYAKNGELGGSESVVLRDGDCVTIDISDAKDVQGGDDAIKRFIEKAARKVERRSATGRFSGWRFYLEYGDKCLWTASEAFDLLQITIAWRPGDARVLLQSISVTALPDGNTQGKLWIEDKLESGTSLKIKIQGAA